MKTSNWPWNLYKLIFGRNITESDLSADYHEALDHVLTHTMPERDVLVLRQKYQEGLSNHKIGENIGISAEGVRYCINAAVRKMRHPKRVKYLLYGMAAGSNNEPENAPIEKVGIENLDMSTLVFNCLKRAGIDTVEQLLKKTRDELLKIRGFGKGSLEAVEEALAQWGLELYGDN